MWLVCHSTRGLDVYLTDEGDGEILFLFGLLAMVKCELFTAIATMEPLLHAEMSVASNIDAYIGLEMAKIEKLRE